MDLHSDMYVRTKDGIIAKCLGVNVNRYMFDRIILENGYYNDWEFIDIPKEKSLIKKASYNPIDLIEVGDYVNGFKVDEIGEYHSIRTDKVETYVKVNCSALLNCFYEEDIKSIVTKEQFEQIQYRIGD